MGILFAGAKLPFFLVFHTRFHPFRNIDSSFGHKDSFFNLEKIKINLDKVRLFLNFAANKEIYLYDFTQMSIN